ncbi:LysR family transcriptional regulator [Sandaracinus amylolyticus]|uniref:Transcriptional regulator, LysR family protein n=1 Tax=Sandaracinus amylolyticus TaxID=927083 RepID=A0A0F6YMT6_9BACT|nr:LysR family transcriptional regulator [Sandaracinus amylolyticus]AKF11720.1 Transcriptional regulator, LysR family protein [Sandaracinus amylolyticus]
MKTEIAGLLSFVAVVEEGSFRRAAERLGVTSSAVSQSVARIEEHLGVQLLHRTTRSVVPTEAGEQLQRTLGPLFAEIRSTLDAAGALRGRPAGTLRLTVSSIAESFLSESTLQGFLARYPEIRLELSIDDRDVDIVSEGFDAGVRLGEVIDEDMVAVSVSRRQRQIVVGAPCYLERHGVPQHPRDLHRHSCIGWRRFDLPAAYRWELVDRGKDIAVPVKSRVETNDMGVMIRLARAGVGLTIGMEETFAPYVARGELVPVLEAFAPSFPGFFLYYPRRARLSPKLQALLDYVREQRRPAAPQPAKRRKTRR